MFSYNDDQATPEKTRENGQFSVANHNATMPPSSCRSVFKIIKVSHTCACFEPLKTRGGCLVLTLPISSWRFESPGTMPPDLIHDDSQARVMVDQSITCGDARCDVCANGGMEEGLGHLCPIFLCPIPIRVIRKIRSSKSPSHLCGPLCPLW